LIRLEEWVDIVSRHNAGQSIKGFARDLGVSRNTVRTTLRREGPPAPETIAWPGFSLADYAPPSPSREMAMRLT